MKNNKPELIARLVVLCVLLVVVLIFCVQLLTNGFDGFVFHLGGNHSLPYETQSPQAGATSLPVTTVAPDGKNVVLLDTDGVEATTLNISLIQYDITITKSAQERLVVTFSGDAGTPIPECTLQNGMLTILQRNNINTQNRKGMVTVELPTNLVRNCGIYTVSGDAFVYLTPESVLFSATSGSLTLNGDGSGKSLEVNTVSGEAKVKAPYQVQTLNSTSGSFYVQADENTQQVKCNTVSGDLTVKLAKTDDYSLTYSGISGDVRDHYSGQQVSRSGSMSQGKGTLKIDVSAVSGSVDLEDW